MPEYKTIPFCDAEVKRRKKLHNDKLKKERLLKVRQQSNNIATQSRIQFQQAEKRVETNFTENLKHLWEEQQNRRKQELQKQIEEQKELIGKGHENAKEFQANLEMKCEIAKVEWKEQNKRTDVRTKKAYGRIRMLKRKWAEQEGERMELRRKTKEYVLKNEARMKAKREKLLGSFAHFIVSNPNAFGDVSLKPYIATNVAEALDRTINPRIIRHKSPEKTAQIQEIPQAPVIDEASKLQEQRKRALERGKIAMQKLREEKVIFETTELNSSKQQLAKKAEKEVEEIELRKKQLEKEIEEGRKHIDELNQIKAFQSEVLEKRRKAKETRLHAHRKKQKNKEAPTNNSVKFEKITRNIEKKRNVVTVPTVASIAELDKMNKPDESIHPRTESLLTEELLKPLEPNSLFASMSGLTSIIQPSDVASFQKKDDSEKDPNMFSRISQSFTYSSSQLPHSTGQPPQLIPTPSPDSPYSNYSTSKLSDIDANVKKYIKSPTPHDFLEESTIQPSTVSSNHPPTMNPEPRLSRPIATSDKMTRSTVSLKTPAVMSSASDYQTPNTVRFTDSFDFDPIRVSPAYQDKRMSSNPTDLFDYDPRLTVYENGSRPNTTPDKNYNRLGQSQPISIPSSAKPRNSVELSNSSTGNSQINMLDTMELFQPLKPIDDLLGNLGLDTLNTTAYHSSINTEDLIGSKIADSVEIDAMLKHVENMEAQTDSESKDKISSINTSELLGGKLADSAEIDAMLKHVEKLEPLAGSDSIMLSSDQLFKDMNNVSFDNSSSAVRPLIDLSVSFDSIQDIALPPPPEYVSQIIDPVKEHLDAKISELEQFEKHIDHDFDSRFNSSFNLQENSRKQDVLSPTQSKTSTRDSPVLGEGRTRSPKRSQIDVNKLKLLKTKKTTAV